VNRKNIGRKSEGWAGGRGGGAAVAEAAKPGRGSSAPPKVFAPQSNTEGRSKSRHSRQYGCTPAQRSWEK